PFSSGKERGNQMCQSCAFGRSWLVANSPACSCQVVGVLQNCLTVTAEVASSSLVVPAILFSSCYALKKRAWAHSWHPGLRAIVPGAPTLARTTLINRAALEAPFFLRQAVGTRGATRCACEKS